MHQTLAAALVGLTLSAFVTPQVQASDLALTWNSVGPACPDAEQLRAGIARRLEREISLGPDSELRMSGRISMDAAGYRLDLSTRTRAGEQRRLLHAATCNELARASILIAALLLGPSAGPSLPAAEAHAAARAPRVYARAQLVGDLGALPLPALGAAVLVGLDVDRLTLELGGTSFLPREAKPAERAGPAAALQLTAAQLDTCWRMLNKPLLAPCVKLEAGALRASAEELTGIRAASVLWLAVGVGARLGVPLTRTWQWTNELAISVPWDRTQVGISALGPVHQVPAVFGRITSGMQAYF